MKETKGQIMEGVEGAERSRVIGANTVEYWKKGAKVIRLHHTDIVTFNPDESITLNSGGWKTPTTKGRMNEYLPPEWGIVQEKSIWYLAFGKYSPGHFPFADGITFYPDGTVTGAGADTKESLKLKKKIKGYVEGFMAELLAGNIPKPSGGDCWLCSVTGGDNSHLLCHIEKGYYVPRLLVNALDDFPISQAARSQVGFWLHYHEQDSDWLRDIAVTQVKKSLTRYMKRHLGLAA